MKQESISFQSTNSFSKIVLDYLSNEPKLESFFNRKPDLESFSNQILEKKFSIESRKVLVSALKKQYENAGIKWSKDLELNQSLEHLSANNSFTVCTGHQLNLFTGPVYFIYKIVSAIKLAMQLKEEHSDQYFVPVYWMATEDHDFEEIKYFMLHGKKYSWDSDQEGAVGRMNTSGLEQILSELEEQLPNFSGNANSLIERFKKAYCNSHSLAIATRILVHDLFPNSGLVIIDGDDIDLKRRFAPIMQKEIEEKITESTILVSNSKLEKLSYKIQVNPRDINLFYLQNQSRKRLTFKGNKIVEEEGLKEWSEKELLEEINEFPERFSPNVLLRPVYQESILPNLAYIGGGGELAYWLQLKELFSKFNLAFPILLLRNSALFFESSAIKAQEKLKISNEELFMELDQLKKKHVLSNSSKDLELTGIKKTIHEEMKGLIGVSNKIDKSLNDHVAAIAQGFENKLDALSKQFIRREKKNQDLSMKMLDELKENLFPKSNLQERSINFSQLYLIYGEDLVNILLKHFSLPAKEFSLFKA